MGQEEVKEGVVEVAGSRRMLAMQPPRIEKQVTADDAEAATA